MPRDNRIFMKSGPGTLADNETLLANGVNAPRAGAELRAARDRLAWALPDVAAMLRIKPAYLEALEAGRLSQLPGNTYAVGFVRSYAASLGLDPEELVRRFRAETGEMAKSTELIFPSAAPERGLPAGALALLGLLLVGGAYIGWYRLSGEGKLPAETVAPVPTRLQPLAQQALPGPDGRIPVPPPPPAPLVETGDPLEPRHAAVEDPLLKADPEPPAPVTVTEAAPVSSGAPTTANAMPVMPPPRTAVPIAAVSQPPAVMAPPGTRILLHFTGDAWVQVKERGGPALLGKTMKAGETFIVPAKANLTLTTGNAGVTEILVDGAVVPAIGALGSVRKDVPLDPDALKAGTAVPVAAKRS